MKTRIVLQSFYQNWAKSCLPLAIFISIVLTSSLDTISWPVWLIWMQFPCYLLHEFEEHVCPGGFKEFVNQRVFHSTQADQPLTAANVFWINIPFIWVVFPVFAVLAQNVDIKLGLVLPVFALFNATLHIIATLVKRCYNPGLLVSVVVNYPTGIYTLYYLAHANLTTSHDFWLAFLFALVSHVGLVLFVVTQYRRSR